MGAVVNLGGSHPGYVSDRLAFVNLASLASSALSATLVAILVAQVFSFVESRFGAVFGLVVALLLFAALRAVQSNDRAAHVDAVPAPRGVAPPLRPVSAGQ
jgi:hypothetical protein